MRFTPRSVPIHVLPSKDAAELLAKSGATVSCPTPGQLGSQAAGREVVTVRQFGGDLVSNLVTPETQIVKWGWRLLPEESMFSSAVNPRSPLQFQLGAFVVPAASNLWLFDHECNVYRFSGLDPLDWVLAERGRYNGSMAFDLNVGGRRIGNLRFELDPHPITPGRQEYVVTMPESGEFNRAAYNSFAAATAAGMAVFPPGEERAGPRNGPFCIVVEEKISVSIDCVVWRRLTSPIACIEGLIAGYLVDAQTSRQLVAEARL